MQRCFIAFELESGVSSKLRESVEPLRRAMRPHKPRFLEPAAYHVTLRFLGAINAADLERLSGGVRELVKHHTAFRSRFLGFGGLPRRAKAHVLVAVMADERGTAQALNSELCRLCSTQGFSADRQQFRPHATLARFQTALDMRPYLSLARPPADTVQLSSIALYKSTLAPGGARYSVLERFPLAMASGA